MAYEFSLAGIEPVSKNPYPFTALQTAWLEALESDNYKQGQGVLCTAQNEFCCLGVVAELSGAKKSLHYSGKGYMYAWPHNSDLDFGSWGGVGHLSYDIRRLARLRNDTGGFAQSVFFPGLPYGEIQDQFRTFGDEKNKVQGHRSLAAMNDARCIPVGNEGKVRAFNFREIAAYIRHDPWNVFFGPDELGNHVPSPLPTIETAYAAA